MAQPPQQQQQSRLPLPQQLHHHHPPQPLQRAQSASAHSLHSNASSNSNSSSTLHNNNKNKNVCDKLRDFLVSFNSNKKQNLEPANFAKYRKILLLHFENSLNCKSFLELLSSSPEWDKQLSPLFEQLLCATIPPNFEPRVYFPSATYQQQQQPQEKSCYHRKSFKHILLEWMKSIASYNFFGSGYCVRALQHCMKHEDEHVAQLMFEITMMKIAVFRAHMRRIKNKHVTKLMQTAAAHAQNASIQTEMRCLSGRLLFEVCFVGEHWRANLDQLHLLLAVVRIVRDITARLEHAVPWLQSVVTQATTSSSSSLLCTAYASTSLVIAPLQSTKNLCWIIESAADVNEYYNEVAVHSPQPKIKEAYERASKVAEFHEFRGSHSMLEIVYAYLERIVHIYNLPSTTTTTTTTTLQHKIRVVWLTSLMLNISRAIEGGGDGDDDDALRDGV